MPLPLSPNTISLGQVNTELGLSATATISLNDTAVRNLAGVPSGMISMSNLHGQSNVDPFFNYNTILLTAEGSNGFTNGSFTESSGNNLTITRSGNVKLGPFSPNSPKGWSTLFNTGTVASRLTSDYTSSVFNAGSGPFQYECFFYITAWSASSHQFLVSNVAQLASPGDYGIVLGVRVSDKKLFGNTKANNSSESILVSTTTLQLNIWYHAVLCRTGTTYSLFLNGTREATATNSINVNSSGTGTNTIAVGSYYNGNSGANNLNFIGYISNVRVFGNTNPTYPATNTSITVPTTTLTGGDFLACTTATQVANVGSHDIIGTNTRMFPFSPFTNLAVYSKATHGGSVYFDGAGDHLALPASTSSLYLTGAFTFECWFHPIVDKNGTHTQLYGNWNNNTGNTWSFAFKDGGLFSTGLRLFWYRGNYGTNECALGTTSNSIKRNAWNHIAIVRTSGNTVYMFVNGVSQALTTYNSGLTWDNSFSFTSTAPIYIGGSTNYPTKQYISNLRFVSGQALYTSNFTPSTQPLTAVSGTQLLFNANNTCIDDATTRQHWECYGGAQISTSQFKNGSSSFYLPSASSSYILAHENWSMNIGGDFTIEAWIYLLSLPTADSWPTTYQNHMVIIASGTPSLGDGIGFLIGSSRLALHSNDVVYWSTAHGLSTNTWYHVAVSRSGSTLYYFVNGVAKGTNTWSGVAGTGSNTYIGCETGQGAFLNGYIDDIRVTSGKARYTSNFTPPTSLPFK